MNWIRGLVAFVVAASIIIGVGLWAIQPDSLKYEETYEMDGGGFFFSIEDERTFYLEVRILPPSEFGAAEVFVYFNSDQTIRIDLDPKQDSIEVPIEQDEPGDEYELIAVDGSNRLVANTTIDVTRERTGWFDGR